MSSWRVHCTPCRQYKPGHWTNAVQAAELRGAHVYPGFNLALNHDIGRWWYTCDISKFIIPCWPWEGCTWLATPSIPISALELDGWLAARDTQGIYPPDICFQWIAWSTGMEWSTGIEYRNGLQDFWISTGVVLSIAIIHREVLIHQLRAGAGAGSPTEWTISA